MVETDFFVREQKPLGLRVLGRRLRGATFVEHRVKSVINSPESTGMGFWSINPYVGCEFGCTYCYARYAHEYVMQRAHDAGRISKPSNTWDVFEQTIFIKQRDTVLWSLERDLQRMHQRTRRGQVNPLVIGTATDPYQPAEKTFHITKSVLQRLTRERGLSIGIISKSALICRDIDLLVELHARHRLTVYVSLITVNPDLIKLFEARSPQPHVRLKTLKRLTDANINAGLIVAPVLPGITDSVDQIKELIVAAKANGGRFANPSPLRMYAALHRGFLPLIEEHFPDLYPKYRRAYRGTGAAPKHYTDAVLRRFRKIALEHGMPVRDPVLESRQKTPYVDKDQLRLFG